MTAELMRDLIWFVENKFAEEFTNNLNKPWNEQLSVEDNIREVAVMTIDRMMKMAAFHRATIQRQMDELPIEIQEKLAQ